MEFHLLTNSHTSDMPRKTIMVSWAKPGRNHYKLNMYSSSLGNPEVGGIGRVFRNSKGNWVLGFIKGVPKATNNMTEFGGLLY